MPIASKSLNRRIYSGEALRSLSGENFDSDFKVWISKIGKIQNANPTLQISSVFASFALVRELGELRKVRPPGAFGAASNTFRQTSSHLEKAAEAPESLSGPELEGVLLAPEAVVQIVHPQGRRCQSSHDRFESVESSYQTRAQ